MKIFSSIKWAIIVGSLCLWVLSVDHIARETEKEITASIDAFLHTNEHGLIKPSLVEYKRTILSSTFSIALSSDHPSIHHSLENVIVSGKVQHGPIILLDNGLAFKTAHVNFSIDKNISSDSIDEKLVSAQMLVDYDLMRYVDITLKAFTLDISGIALASKEASMHYAFQPDDTFPDELELSLPELSFRDRENQAQLSDSRVLLSLSSANNGLDSLRFVAKDASFEINNIIDQDNVELAAEVAFTDKDVVSFQTDLTSKDNADVSTNIQIDHLNLNSFKDTFIGFLDYRNVSDQIDWTLEDFAYSPDGQDRLYELLGRLDEHGDEISDILANRMLTPHKSRLQVSQTGNDSFFADLRFLGISDSQSRSIWLNSLAGTIQSNNPFSKGSWLDLLEESTTLTVSKIGRTPTPIQTQ